MLLALAGAVAACARPAPRTEPHTAPSSVVGQGRLAGRTLTLPSGWLAVERCDGGLTLTALRITSSGWVELRGDVARRLDVALHPVGQDGGAPALEGVFAGVVHVQVGQPDDLMFGLLEEQTTAVHLEAVAGGAAELRWASRSPRTSHTLSCRLRAATAPEQLRFDRILAAAESPEHCKRASECCRALGGPSACDEGERCRSWRPICDGAQTDPQRCKAWHEERVFAPERPRALPEGCRLSDR